MKVKSVSEVSGDETVSPREHGETPASNHCGKSWGRAVRPAQPLGLPDPTARVLVVMSRVKTTFKLVERFARVERATCPSLATAVSLGCSFYGEPRAGRTAA